MYKNKAKNVEKERKKSTLIYEVYYKYICSIRREHYMHQVPTVTSPVTFPRFIPLNLA